uniref:Uncharacterized protein n=1 Tax=Anguilla anguilla TaxID=7936 RepID=A0A0E9XVT3_ANGAN
MVMGGILPIMHSRL